MAPFSTNSAPLSSTPCRWKEPADDARPCACVVVCAEVVCRELRHVECWICFRTVAQDIGDVDWAAELAEQPTALGRNRRRESEPVRLRQPATTTKWSHCVSGSCIARACWFIPGGGLVEFGDRVIDGFGGAFGANVDLDPHGRCRTVQLPRL